MDNVYATSSGVQVQQRFQLPIFFWPNDQIAIGERTTTQKFEDGDPNALNGRFVEALDKVRMHVVDHGLELSEAKCNDFLEEFMTVGKSALTKMFGEDKQRIKEIEQENEARGLSLSLWTRPGRYLFWEMVYTGTSTIPDPNLFWGFRHPINHVYWDTGGKDTVLLQNGLFSVIHSRLDKSQEEVEQIEEYLEKLRQTSGLDICYRALDDEVIGDEQALFNLFGSIDRFRYGLVHFACHCENPTDGAAAKAYLRFTANGKPIDLYLEKLISTDDSRFCNKPFVFLNACGSATSGHLLQSDSFPKGVLDFGAAGVIATACTVPDIFASAFGREFYRRLLLQIDDEDSTTGSGAQPVRSNYVDISLVLLKTRRHFLEKYKNPLGLAYGLYAPASQRLQLTG
jgi:hypothetical protein